MLRRTPHVLVTSRGRSRDRQICSSARRCGCMRRKLQRRSCALRCVCCVGRDSVISQAAVRVPKLVVQRQVAAEGHEVAAHHHDQRCADLPQSSGAHPLSTHGELADGHPEVRAAHAMETEWGDTRRLPEVHLEGLQRPHEEAARSLKPNIRRITRPAGVPAVRGESILHVEDEVRDVYRIMCLCRCGDGAKLRLARDAARAVVARPPVHRHAVSVWA